jgi:hypothetical protein
MAGLVKGMFFWVKWVDGLLEWRRLREAVDEPARFGRHRGIDFAAQCDEPACLPGVL